MVEDIGEGVSPKASPQIQHPNLKSCRTKAQPFSKPLKNHAAPDIPEPKSSYPHPEVLPLVNSDHVLPASRV